MASETPSIPLAKDKLSTVCLWLSDCIENHSKCRETLSGIIVPKAEANRLPTRVIDFGTTENPNIKLLESQGLSARYAALSYCWGSPAEVKPLRTLKSNINTFQSCIPVADLPKTIKDAVLVTQRIGLRYLWVDSLCIIQDDDADWKTESKRMGSIFEFACCTLAATGARHADEGLFLENCLEDTTPLDHETMTVTLQLEAPSYEYLYADTDDFNRDVTNSPWNSRAWIVQERILSRRIVHFGQASLYWECQHDAKQESHPKLTVPGGLDRKPAVFSRFKRESSTIARWTPQAFTQTRHYLGAVRSVVRQKVGFAEDYEDIQPIIYRFWSRIVRTYNSCDLTVASDKLPALDGLAKAVGTVTKQTYYAGIWLEDLARCLYWRSDSDNTSFSGLKKHSGATAPTWSWASWSGAVRMGSFMAELDPENPRASSTTIRAVQRGESPMLYLYAQTRNARPRVPSKFTDLFGANAYKWISDAWWTVPPFNKPIDAQFRNRTCLELEVIWEDGVFSGHALLDDDRYAEGSISLPDEMVCVILHTEPVKNVASEQKGLGFYILVVQQSADHPDRYERLGVGVSYRDSIPDCNKYPWPKKPTPSITLI